MKTYKSIILFAGLVAACSNSSVRQSQMPDKDDTENRKISQVEKDYWYNRDAEITSYELTQARYGELHKGTAVFIFVTEPFSMNSNAKADHPTEKDIPVLKLNHVRKFNTGIYPYSMMTSSFLPFKNGDHSLKLSSSSQEWCGNTYMELRNGENFDLTTLSYFEGENKTQSKLKKHLLEDDLWSMIRVRNDKLPIGEHLMYPSLMFCRLMHLDFKPYTCQLALESKGDNKVYKIYFPELEKSSSITFETGFPYNILAWEENYYDGWGANRKKLTTTAYRMEQIKIDYWNKNHVEDSIFRSALQLN